MSNITIITPEEWLIQKWKNGGGTTNELYSESDDKGIICRLSIAEARLMDA
jgi:environmental stress-induced protein Ves